MLTDWVPIGDEKKPFTGVFEGGGNTITLTSFDPALVTTKSYLGIFGYVRGTASAKAQIKNLNVVSSIDATSLSTTTGHAVGLVVGMAELTVIDNVTLSGTFSFYSTRTCYVGGVAGVISGDGAVIKNTTSTLTMDISPGVGGQLIKTNGVLAYSYIGGIVGLFQLRAGIENCHTRGDITADNVRNTASGQVFVGGITGGSPYAFHTDAHGYIHDSSFTDGTIRGVAKGFWSWVGGIAGNITGGTVNDKNRTTRIERCFATGTVSTEGTKSGYPYVGGIVGYNYYGALTSQSYFTGNVITDSGLQDYAGGIAGYNSQTTAPYNSRIEDCWSGGSVTGYRNAGGIVGQNQVNTYIRRCYSIAAVKATNSSGFGVDGSGFGVGGIAGLNASTLLDAITSSVALNLSITAAAGNNVNRVIGSSAGVSSKNYALSTLVPTTSDIYTEDKGLGKSGGEDIPDEFISGGKPTQEFYETVLGWDFFTVWKMGADGYPNLQWQQE